MNRLRAVPVVILFLAGCLPKDSASTKSGGTPSDGGATLADARKDFATKLARRERANVPVPRPPAGVFDLVQYESSVGKLAAYLTPEPGDGKKRPAIIWITGGDCNTIGDVWSPTSPINDQTARQYRESGMVMMFPSMRGGNDNPGVRECLFGEVDDVLAATDFLAKQPHVDPDRIYLGGHSTGGTLVMLVAASTDRFRAVFSFGPVHDISYYPDDIISAVNVNDSKEVRMRSPMYWLQSIQCPTFVIEGDEGNASALRMMEEKSTNPNVRFFVVNGADHFSVLAPANRVIAKKIATDTGAETNLSFTAAELNHPTR